jgi:hypothetical protein
MQTDSKGPRRINFPFSQQPYFVQKFQRFVTKQDEIGLIDALL